MLRPRTPARSLLLLACVSCILFFTLVPRYDLLSSGRTAHQMSVRGLFDIGDSSTASTPGSSTAAPSSSTDPPSSTAPTSTSTSTTPTSSAPASTPTSSAPASASTPTSAPPQSSAPSDTSAADTSSTDAPPSSTDPATSNTSASPTQSQPTNTGSPSQSQRVSVSIYSSLSTNAEGQTVTVLSTVTSQLPSSASASSTSAADTDDDTDKGVSTSTIVGLSVAGGIALLGIVGFVVWKFTRKRFSDDFDDNEAIKWPELNTHGDNGLALPTNRAGAFETTSEVNLTRPDSRAGSIAPSAATSAVDLYAPNAAQDPYAVPPLPHLNPNQPYRDDPTGSFYDPYNGPVPQTFSEVPGAEAIPMTQINRMRSPAPGMDPGRVGSPGPQAPYYAEGGRSSPAPRAMSPGPGMALSGRASPGPGPALTGRSSPGPGQAYGYAG